MLAIRPQEVWSWDITKLKGPAKWTCFHLYVILDIFSRYIVGWMIAARESAELAEQIIADTAHKEHIIPGTLTLHADRGSSMRSKPVAALLVDLDIIKTHSRPHVSDDNPYSEAQFKTLKYRPDFPARFGSIEDARAHCQVFFRWYNTVHRHSGIGLMTPYTVHHGHAEQLTEERGATLMTAFADHPQRFKGLAPKPPAVPNSRLDQSTEKGNRNPRNHHQLAKHFTPCVSKSLTCSELGPIDPQISVKDINGNDVNHSVLTYLNAYQEATQALKDAPDDPGARISFEKFDPTLVRKFSSIRDRARLFAENLLKRRGLNFSKIASDLMDINTYPSHGQMISWEAAQNIGLNVTYLTLSDPLWRKYWSLYCHLRLAIESEQRIFESSYVSLVI